MTTPATVTTLYDQVSTPSGTTRLFWVLVAVLTVASIVPVWAFEYFPTHNGPSLLLITYMERELSNPELNYSEFYERHNFPVPYLLHSAVVHVLFPVCDPVIADKVWVTLLIVLRPLALIYFLRQLGQGREVYALLCFAFLFDFSMMRGYHNYHAGISIGFIIFGYFIQHRDRWTVWSIAGFNALTMIQYFAHPVALVATGLLLAAYEFAHTRSVLRVVGIVIRGYLPCVSVLSVYMVWNARHSAWAHETIALSSVSDKIQNVLYRGASPLSLVVAAVSLALLAALLGYALVAVIQRYRSRHERAGGWRQILQREPMWFVFAMCLALYLVLPWDLSNWHKADVRIIPFLFALALALPPKLSQRRGAVFAIVVSGLTLVGLVLQASQLRQSSDLVAEYTAGIDTVPMGSKMLAVTNKKTNVGQWTMNDSFEPLQHADSYYALRRGGVTNRCLAKNNTIYCIWYKDYDKPDLRRRAYPLLTKHPTSTELEHIAESYDVVLLWDVAADRRGMLCDVGFDPVFQQGRMTVLRKE